MVLLLQSNVTGGLGFALYCVDRPCALGSTAGRGRAEGSPHSLFLQEVHLHPSHLQESAQVQEPPREGGTTGRVKVVKLGVGPGPLGEMTPFPQMSLSKGVGHGVLCK